MYVHPDHKVLVQWLLWRLGPIMGLWNIGLLHFSKTMSRKAQLIAGAIIGLRFAIFGVSTGAPTELYKLKGIQAYMMIPIGTLSHTLIWGVIVYWTNGVLVVRE